MELLKTAEKLEQEGFAQFAEGSLLLWVCRGSEARAKTNCYLTAAEALEFGLVAAILQ
ncbi:hypothetical protein NKJ59_24030 [Mesorhizobium australicum]|uniref:hypothetical protein n=1 Tax=Mesorhizobium australicum TaxID=536018 RepID=UPI003338A6EA